MRRDSWKKKKEKKNREMVEIKELIEKAEKEWRTSVKLPRFPFLYTSY